MAQQTASCAMTLCSISMSGLPRLLQLQLALSGVVQQTCRLSMSGTAAEQHIWVQPQQRMASTSSSSSSCLESLNSNSISNSSNGSSRSGRGRKVPTRRAAAHQARLPKARKYGPQLRDIDPEAFERMRLVVGYYDLPENLSKRRPALPTHVTINNLQALKYTKDVDPYYKLALLSYRSKLENIEILQSLSKTRAFLQQLSAPPAFVPANLDAFGAAVKGQQQQGKHPSE